MASFFGISPGEEKIAPGLRVRVTPDGEDVWMHGKWLGLSSDHAVAWFDRGATATFVRPDGLSKIMGDFPAWVVSGKAGDRAVMFDASQFRGGKLVIRQRGKGGKISTRILPM